MQIIPKTWLISHPIESPPNHHTQTHRKKKKEATLPYRINNLKIP
jgi:hypothetical protein